MDAKERPADQPVKPGLWWIYTTDKLAGDPLSPTTTRNVQFAHVPEYTAYRVWPGEPITEPSVMRRMFYYLAHVTDMTFEEASALNMMLTGDPLDSAYKAQYDAAVRTEK